MIVWNWIPMSERRPDAIRHVIGYDAFYNRVGEICLQYGDTWGFVDSQKDDCFITHWMLLPQPPPGEAVEDEKRALDR